MRTPHSLVASVTLPRSLVERGFFGIKGLGVVLLTTNRSWVWREEQTSFGWVQVTPSFTAKLERSCHSQGCAEGVEALPYPNSPQDPVMLFRREAQPGPSSIRVVPVPVPAVNRIRMIEPQLRSQYDELLNEPVPGKLAELARRFEDVTATLLVRKGPRDGKDAPASTGPLSG